VKKLFSWLLVCGLVVSLSASIGCSGSATTKAADTGTGGTGGTGKDTGGTKKEEGTKKDGSASTKP